MIFNPAAAAAAAQAVQRQSTVQKDPPLLLSTERTEQAIEHAKKGPTEYTVAGLMNAIVKHDINIDSDEEGNFDQGKHGAALAGMDEERILEQIKAWEKAKKEKGYAKGKGKGKGVQVTDEGSSDSEASFFDRGMGVDNAAKGKGKGKAIAAFDNDDNNNSSNKPTVKATADDASSVYSRDIDGHSIAPAMEPTPAPAPKLTSAQKKKKRKGGKKHQRPVATDTTNATTTTSSTEPSHDPSAPHVKALSDRLAMGEHVVDVKKVMREADEAEARGEKFDMVKRIMELQTGQAEDCGPLVDGLASYLKGAKMN